MRLGHYRGRAVSATYFVASGRSFLVSVIVRSIHLMGHCSMYFTHSTSTANIKRVRNDCDLDEMENDQD